MKKKIWIPVILMTGIAAGIAFWHQHITSREPMNQSREDANGQIPIPDLYGPYLKTAESVQRHMQRVRDGYVKGHFSRYPKCRAYKAVLADAEQYAEWHIADLEYTKISAGAFDGYSAVFLEAKVLRDFMKRFQSWESLTITEKSDLIAEHIARKYGLLKMYEAASKRRKKIKQQRPIFQPKHRH